jgi:predicted site-specific integrase-resolvase
MNDAKALDRLLTTSEVCDLWGFEPQTLRKWRCTGRGDLNFIRIGKSIRYRQSDIEAYLVTNEATSTAALNARNN